IKFNPRPTDQCEDPEMFESMNMGDTAVGNIEDLFPEIHIPTYTVKPFIPLSIETTPLAIALPSTSTRVSPQSIPIQPYETGFARTGSTITSPNTIDLLQTRPIQIEATRTLVTMIQENGRTTTYPDDPRTMLDPGGLDNIQTGNMPYVNSSGQTKAGTTLEISTTASTIVGITAGLVFAGLIAFAVYRHQKSSRIRIGSESQEQLVVDA
ncbi:10528_t:CDS:2, partial [Acaulospora colombiana]